MSILVYKKILSEYLREKGLVIPSQHELIERKLQKAMGKRKYAEYAEVCERVHNGDPRYTIDSIYTAVMTKEEAHLLFSHQSDVALECFAWMASNLHRYVTSRSVSSQKALRVAEVGCATGLLSAALSGFKEFQHITFTAYDRQDHFLEMAREEGARVDFVSWNYASENPLDGGFDVVLASLAIDFHAVIPRHHEIGSTSLRETESYKYLKGQSSSVLQNWRLLVKEGGVLMAILRLPSLLEFLALADAASTAGWQIDLDQLQWIEVDDQRIPAMVFKTGAPILREEKELASAWMAGSLRAGNGGIYSNDAATALYRLLEPKEVMKEGKMEYPDGNVMISVVARCGPFALQFAEATTGFGRLEIHPIHKLAQLEPKFDW